MKSLFSFFFLLLFIHLQAQTVTISGTVTDSSGPLPGVSVVVEGTTNGTQTNFDGQYNIQSKKGQTLVFTYLGYESEKIRINDSKVIDVVLTVSSEALDEVVVTGYATKTVKALTASVTTVGTPTKAQLARNKRKQYHNSITHALQGKAAGIQITGANGQVGASTNITIRGVNSINGSSQPLYIVDGTPIHTINNTVVANLKPETIEKINIYKPAKARKLFGVSAKNGCVVISTKSGNYQIQKDEQYAQITENKFERVQLSPLSTFSIDVDKAAYSNIRRMINNGQQVPVDAVKIEEMINYFDYQYPQPAKHPFSINTEVVQTPWNSATQLVRIGLQGKTYENTDLPASNLTFLIDVSGSMSSANKLPLLKSAFKLLVNQLREKDKVSIVVYAGAAGEVLSPTNGTNKEQILAALDNLKAGGSTAGGAGIKLAYQLAQKNYIKNGNNRVILATDGDFNVGASSDKAMVELIEEKRKSGVFLSVLGFGMGNYKDSKLEKLADKGNGNHSYIDTMQEAQKVFGKEFGGTLYTIAKDVKIQVEFNPSVVQAYRLIGYENRILNDEDFIDDTVDAGELGSGHTVTALYEVIPVGVSSPYLKDINSLKYTVKNEGIATNELLTVKFRYKKPNGNKSIEIESVVANQNTTISADGSFAASVALFGLHLRKSQYLNNSNIEDILKLAENGLQQDINGYKAEFIRLVKSYTNVL
ncbi:hypothetical protein GCM10011414_11800 [Croceivirga lutea]|uniref:VWA domain-containing protein n=1 Tax=Croceivirga lutea TaxID=1775167 RepID=UPI00163A6639|nr:VWA domain-containing protein [Croceivirga lutea]GGG43802.1 hypothetical protein GCM10011414_11800 [Croceivirga lutea]